MPHPSMNQYNYSVKKGKNMDHINISDFQISTSISGIYRVSDISAKSSKNGNTYLKAVISDTSGSIDMICWEYDGHKPDPASELISVVGNVGSYNGKAQFTAESYRFLTTQECAAIDLVKLIPTAPICVEEYKDRLCRIIDSISNESLYSICQSLFDSYWNDFITIPAAQYFHHAFLHGLLMHTVDMAELAASAALNRPKVNRDLLLAGVLLHDIGKIHEFNRSPCTGLVTGYTEAGDLLGHAAIGFQMIGDAAKHTDADPFVASLLQYIVLTHHGDHVNRSSRQPQRVEAELLRKLDALDSSCESCLESQRQSYTECLDRSAAAGEQIIHRSATAHDDW